VDRGVIEEAAAGRIVEALKRTYYPKRSTDALYQIAKKELADRDFRALADFLKNEGMDYKQNDAIFLIKAVKKRCHFF
jgi:hypothetical protein